MEYSILSPGDEWMALTDRLDDIYYTSDYYALSALVQPGEPRCFHFMHDGKEAFYPFMLADIPDTGLYDIQGAYGYNGVSCAERDPEFIRAFHDKFSSWCAGQGVVAEFTRFHPLTQNEDFSKTYLRVLSNRTTIGVDLSQGYAHIWEHEYSTNNRNLIRRGRKEGIEIRLAETEADYLTFGATYRKLMEQRGAGEFFLWPDAYFSAIYGLNGNSRMLLLATVNGKDAGGALFMMHGTNVHYHLAARDASMAPLPVANALLDEGIRRAWEQGYLWMHLGGGLSNSPADPLLAFKRKFSHRTFDFRIGTRIHNATDYELLVRAWEKQNPGTRDAYKNYFLRYRLT